MHATQLQLMHTQSPSAATQRHSCMSAACPKACHIQERQLTVPARLPTEPTFGGWMRHSAPTTHSKPAGNGQPTPLHSPCPPGCPQSPLLAATHQCAGWHLPQEGPAAGRHRACPMLRLRGGARDGRAERASAKVGGWEGGTPPCRAAAACDWYCTQHERSYQVLLSIRRVPQSKAAAPLKKPRLTFLLLAASRVVSCTALALCQASKGMQLVSAWVGTCCGQAGNAARFPARVGSLCTGKVHREKPAPATPWSNRTPL